MATQLSKNFTLEELCRSEKALANKIDNIAKGAELEHLKEAVTYMLQPLREAYGKPIKVNSGYRNERVNRLAGGAANSSHKYGYAFDLKPLDGDMVSFQRFILKWAKTNKYDQIIIEQPNSNGVASWIHIGWKRGVNGAQRAQKLAAEKDKNGKWKYFAIYAGTKYYT